MSKVLSYTAGLVGREEGRTERLLLSFATLFLLLFATVLSLAPAVRARSWDVDFRFNHWLGVITWLAVFWIAHRSLSNRLPTRDPYLLPIAALLSGWGLLTIWRLFPEFGLRQTIWLLIAGIILILGFRLQSSLDFLRRFKYIWLTSGLLLTALTLVFGTHPLGEGPKLWLGCCGIYLQPSEPLKLLLIIYLAAYFADRFPYMVSRTDMRAGVYQYPLIPLLAPSLIMAGLALLLLIVQRDLGTASLFLGLYSVLVFLASGKKRILIIAALSLLVTVLIGYFAFDLVRIRVEAWMNPWIDPSGRSYQIVQSLMAVANGGLLGRGPGLGSPGLVPVPHSDFIFSAIAEEMGMIGAFGLLLLLALLAHRGMLCVVNASDIFQRYLAIGLTAYLIFQSILIIGGNLRMLPLTGVTLPFVSYGGSSLVTSFCSLLLLLHISSREKPSRVARDWIAPYFQLGTIMFLGLILIALGIGWWAVVRGPDLLTRTDNPRRAISDVFVRRGSILDRNNLPINTTIGSPGEYVRLYLVPDLSATAGYTSPVYGQAGLEASMDEVLRGIEGSSGLSIWWNHILYGQPPPGLDIRTAINLDLQKTTDLALGNNNGAIIILNPLSGEILALTSKPAFDPNQLDSQWEDLVQDSDTPLINRATQGLYPPGTVLGPLLYAGALEKGEVSKPPLLLIVDFQGETYDCALETDEISWGAALANGCPGATIALAEALGEEDVLELLYLAGVFDPPDIQLPVESINPPDMLADPAETFLGNDLLFSPLQIALAISPLSAEGLSSVPELVTAIENAQLGWIPQNPAGEPHDVVSSRSAQDAANSLNSEIYPVWESVAQAGGRNSNGRAVAWYTGGTLPEWAGTPLVLVVLVEGGNPSMAREIGHQIWSGVLRTP